MPSNGVADSVKPKPNILETMADDLGKECPSTWPAFGTADLEGADFRACQAYGPLYG